MSLRHLLKLRHGFEGLLLHSPEAPVVVAWGANLMIVFGVEADLLNLLPWEVKLPKNLGLVKPVICNRLWVHPISYNHRCVLRIVRETKGDDSLLGGNGCRWRRGLASCVAWIAQQVLVGRLYLRWGDMRLVFLLGRRVVVDSVWWREGRHQFSDVDWLLNLLEVLLHVVEWHIGTSVILVSLAHCKESLVWRQCHGSDLLDRIRLSDESHVIALLILDVPDSDVLA